MSVLIPSALTQMEFPGSLTHNLRLFSEINKAIMSLFNLEVVIQDIQRLNFKQMKMVMLQNSIQ
jgi:hypothetical protein